MKKLISLLSLVAVSAAVMATPAKRGVWKTVTLADGSTVRVELRGDEYMSYWQSAEGQCYVRQADSDLYEVADMAALQSQAKQRREAAPLRAAQQRVTIGGDHEDFVGSKKGLIILAEFSDVKFLAGHDADYYTHVANDLDFTSSDGHVGSIRDYFLAQSYGQFDLTFDVVGPISLKNQQSYYGRNSSSSIDVNVRDMIEETVEGAADLLGDFSDYDWFGDGRVDQVFVIYAGEGEANGGGDDTVWPHRSSIPTKNLGGKKVSTYATSCELQSAGQIDGIGPFCHEFSHCLGLPDLYDTSYSGNYGMSAWDVMESGCYLGNAFRPCGYSGYERNYCGWKDPIYLTDDTHVEGMKGISDGGDYYIIKNDAYDNEYYILENRTRTGWDSELYGEGLLITYIDFSEYLWRNNLINTVDGVSNDHQRYTVFPADNSTASTSTSIAGDVFPYRRNNLFTNYSVPASTLNHANTDGQKYMSKPVTNITRADDGTISFDFANEVGKDEEPLPDGVFFRETFDYCCGDGGNDDTWSVNAADMSPLMTDNMGWTIANGDGGKKCAILGTNSKKGEGTTPAFTINEAAVLTFRAAMYTSGSNALTVSVAEGDATLSETDFTMTSKKWNNYSIDLTASSYPATVKLKIATTRRRFFLDDVYVTTPAMSGIESVSYGADAQASPIYTIDGRRVADDEATLKPGLYIKAGRKLVVK